MASRPAPDRRGAYIVDLRRIRDRPRWTLPSVVAHELLPGHMIQLGLEERAAPHPLRLDYAASFVEGWGIHAEALAAADGAFADPHAMLGHLHWLIFRVARGARRPRHPSPRLERGRSHRPPYRLAGRGRLFRALRDRSRKDRARTGKPRGRGDGVARHRRRGRQPSRGGAGRSPPPPPARRADAHRPDRQRFLTQISAGAGPRATARASDPPFRGRVPTAVYWRASWPLPSSATST
ncbi:MAG: DUF885 family protein [Sphingomonas taxi]